MWDKNRDERDFATVNMSWLSDYKRDLAKYTGSDGGSAWKAVLGEQGLWALLVYRIEASVYRSNMPSVIKSPARLMLTVCHKIIEILTGINLPCTARIGPGLHLPHCGQRVVNGAAVIGEDCCISQGATIGISGRGEQRGVAVLGDRVYVGVNAVVAGKITVGDDALIAANSLVIRDVAPMCGVMGVPAQVLNFKGSADYIVMPRPALTNQHRDGVTLTLK